MTTMIGLVMVGHHKNGLICNIKIFAPFECLLIIYTTTVCMGSYCAKMEIAGIANSMANDYRSNNWRIQGGFRPWSPYCEIGGLPPPHWGGGGWTVAGPHHRCSPSLERKKNVGVRYGVGDKTTPSAPPTLFALPRTKRK
jgi:hypothetical protein